MKANLPLKYTRSERLQTTRRYFLMVIYVLHTTFHFGPGRIAEFLAAMNEFAKEALSNDTWVIEIEDWCQKNGIKL